MPVPSPPARTPWSPLSVRLKRRARLHLAIKCASDRGRGSWGAVAVSNAAANPCGVGAAFWRAAARGGGRHRGSAAGQSALRGALLAHVRVALHGIVPAVARGPLFPPAPRHERAPRVQGPRSSLTEAFATATSSSASLWATGASRVCVCTTCSQACAARNPILREGPETAPRAHTSLLTNAVLAVRRGPPAPRRAIATVLFSRQQPF